MSEFFDFEFRQLARSLKAFSERSMDQWANMRFDSEFGEVFVSVSRQPLPPASVDDYDNVNVWASQAFEPAQRGAGIPDFATHFRWVDEHKPMVFGREATFSHIVSYVQGVDAATDFLDGFHGWLVQRLGGGLSLHWSRLIRHDYFGSEPHHHSTDLPVDWKQQNAEHEEQLVDHIFSLLDLFLAERAYSK